MRTARLLGVGWLMHFKMIMRSTFNWLLEVLWPLFFATVAFFLFRAGRDPAALLYASFGAAVMGVWSATSTSAGNALQRERWHGTLELLVAAPVLSNVIFGLLLIFSGANVPLAELPGWMRAVSERVPFTHGIEAARRLANGDTFGDVGGLVAREALIGVVYVAAGYVLLRLVEEQSRRRATLERA
jgi:ABC-type multidrug transport system permease subunit